MSEALQIEIEKTIKDLEAFRRSLERSDKIAKGQLNSFRFILEELRGKTGKRELLKDKPKGFAIHVERLKRRLMELGAGKEWIKFSYCDIALDLDVSQPHVSAVINELKSQGLRVFRKKFGKIRGNHFTFCVDLVEPHDEPEVVLSEASPVAVLGEDVQSSSLPVEPIKEKAKTDPTPQVKKPSKPVAAQGVEARIQDDVLGVLVGVQARCKTAMFSINLKNLAAKAGHPVNATSLAMTALDENTEITIKKYDSKTLEYFVLMPEGVY